MKTHMCSNYNKQFTNKEICNAFGCYEIATTRIYVSVRDKKISLDVCKNCVHKFDEKEVKHIEEM
jgi:hypothetical protein